jgi:predicted ribosomally synthesized peptide with nif11-like leader
MSGKNVEAFSKALKEDKTLKQQLLLAESDSEVIEIIHQAGYDIDEAQLDELSRSDAKSGVPRMGDVLYPGNPKRRTRATHLASDCSTIITNLETEGQKFDESLKAFNAQIQEMVGHLNIQAPTFKPVDYEVEAWQFRAPEILAPLIIAPIAYKAFQKLAASYMTGLGKTTLKVFSKTLKIPTKLAAKLGGALGAGLVAIGVELIVGAVTGAVEREELQAAINQSVPFRFRLKKDEMIQARRAASLASLLEALSMLEELNYDETILTLLISKKVQKFEQETGNISDNEVKQFLDTLDRNRGSYTVEDPAYPYPAEE